MNKFKEILNKANQFAKNAKNPNRSFLKKYAQSTGEELSPLTVNFEGLRDLISKFRAKLFNAEKSVSALTSSRISNLIESDELFKEDKRKLEQALNLAKSFASTINTQDGMKFSSLKAYGLSSKIRNILADLSIINVNYTGEDERVSQLIVKARADLFEVSNLLNSEVIRYSEKRGVWDKPHRSDTEEIMTNTVGLNEAHDKFKADLNNLISSPNKSPEQIKKLKNQLESINTKIGLKLYMQYLRQLNLLENQVNKVLNSPASVSEVK